MVKSFGWVVIIVSAPVQILGFFGFFRLGLDLGSDLGTCWDGGLGLGQPCMHASRKSTCSCENYHAPTDHKQSELEHFKIRSVS